MKEVESKPIGKSLRCVCICTVGIQSESSHGTGVGLGRACLTDTGKGRIMPPRGKSILGKNKREKGTKSVGGGQGAAE